MKVAVDAVDIIVGLWEHDELVTVFLMGGLKDVLRGAAQDLNGEVERVLLMSSF